MAFNNIDIIDKDNPLISTLSSVGVSISIVNIQYKILFEDKVLKEKFGDNIGDQCYKKYMARDRPCESCPFGKIIKNKSVEKTELVGADGRFYELVSKPLTNSNGTVDKVIEVVMDVTDRRMKEKDLYYKAHIINSDLSAIVSSDLDGTINFVNPAIVRIWGFEYAEELLNRHINILFYQDYFFDEIFDTVKKMGKWFGELKAKKKDGTLFHIQASISLILDDNGKHIGLMASIINITKRKKNEQKLKDSEEKFSLIFQESVFLMGITTIDEGKFVEVNKAFLNSLGFTRDEVIGKTTKELDLYADYHQREMILDRIKNNKKVKNFEVKLKAKDGREFIGLFSTLLIHLQGEPYLLTMANDITELKRAELELKRSEDKFSLVFQESVILMGITTFEEGRFVEVNKAFLSTLGYARDEVIGKTVKELDLYANYYDREQIVEKIKKDKLIQNSEIEFRARDGRKLSGLFSSLKINLEGQLYLLTMVTNVTELKQAELELKRSEEKFSLVFQESIILMGITTFEEGRFVEVNNSFLNTLGFTKEEVIGKTVKELDLYADYYDREKIIERIKKHQSIQNSEIDFKKKDGRKLSGLFSSLIINLEGEPYFLTMVTDITELKRAERELKESEEKYRALFDESPVGILLFDEKYNLLAINEMIEVLIPEVYDEFFQGNYFADLIKLFRNSEELSTIFTKRIELLNRGLKLEPIEIKVVMPSGLEKWLYWQSSRIALHDKTLTQILIHDITEKKEAERLISEERERIQKLSQMRQELITRISHELKTPLTTAHGALQVLFERYKHKLDKDVLEFLNIVKKGTKRLKNLVETLVSTSKFEYKMQELNLQENDILKLVKKQVRELEFYANSRDISIELDLTSKFLLRVDKILFEQVITNILSNAINNTLPGGHVYVSFDEKKTYIDIIIRDTGIGITQEEKARLFTKFGKIERYGKGDNIYIEGVGLGLYISREIVELHGGQIFVESEGRNRGSTFIIRLYKNDLNTITTIV